MEYKLKEDPHKEDGDKQIKKRGRKPKQKLENTEVVKEKKKRGRKPKPKDENEILESTNPKKRGRKPKPKHPLELLAKVPKKRGRKPKDKYGYGLSQSKPVNNFTLNNDNENIILHLPIHSDQLLNNEFVEKKLLEYNPDISVPTPYENVHSNPFGNNYSAPYPFDKQDSSTQENENISNTDNTDTSSDEDSESNDENNYIKMNLKYEDKNLFYETEGDQNDIMECQYDNNNLKIKMNTNISCQNSKNTMLQFKEANNREKWPESTNIYCWWCCSPFNNMPCSLPIKKKNDYYTVLGCFCSPECSAAWNFNCNNEDVWERYSLLNMVYRKVFDNKQINIKLAAPRQSLKIFGGTLTIEEFRKNNSNYNKNYRIVMPPMISIIPQIEEIATNSFYNKNKSFIPIDKERIEKANKDLKLKRSKPLSDKRNTLENCMQLKYI